MLNMIRMEFFRMFKLKSLYIIWIIMAVVIGCTTYMSVEELDMMTQEEKQQMYEEEQKSEVAFGLAVTTPTKPDAQVSVYDMFYANMKGKIIALFMVIFTVLYSTGDISSGYVKNIAGQVKNRRAFQSVEFSSFRKKRREKTVCKKGADDRRYLYESVP